MAAISTRYAQQEKDPVLKTDIHAVRIGDIAFATNRFELFMDYQHRIQGRSPFDQTFIVQLTVDPVGSGTYLATERGEKNKGYSATPYSNQVSFKGGQQLVNETVKMLKELYDAGTFKKNPARVTVPSVKGTPSAADWKKAALLKDFCSAKGDAMARSPMAVRLLHSDKFLYLKLDCGKSDAKSSLIVPPAAMVPRDGAVWHYECCEFFIGRGKESYQFIFAPGEKLTDLSHSAASKTRGQDWNSGKVRLSSKLTSSGWEAFLAIPLDELKFTSSGKKDEYKFNLIRTHLYQTSGGLVKREPVAYLPPVGAHRNIEKLGTLKLAR